MLEQIKVKKWWWENAAELTKNSENLLEDFASWIKQAIVVSAIRSPDFNTTDYLIQLGEIFAADCFSFTTIVTKIEVIRDFHLSIVDKKLDWDTQEIKKLILEKFNNLITDIFNWFNSRNKNKKYPSKENDYTINTPKWDLSILWFGEDLSAIIQEQVINDLDIRWFEAQMLDFTWITGWLSEKLSESELFLALSQEISKRVLFILDNHKIPVISWYVPGFEKWIGNAIWRGYSDATAAMTAVGLSDSYWVTLEIQKSVLWILSSDPRIVKKNNKLIESIDYLTAKEITWARGAQAKLLNHQVLRKELQSANIKVRLFDPFSDSKWTLISKHKNPEASWVEYIGWRKNVIFFTISSWKMSWAWVVSKIFSIVKEYSSLDIISSSETEVTFTLDSWINRKILKKMSEEIREVLEIKEDWYENFVEFVENKALIFCVWQNLHHNKWILGKAATILSEWDINIEVVSQWRMERAIAFWIEGKNMEKAIKLLHKGLI